MEATARIGMSGVIKAMMPGRGSLFVKTTAVDSNATESHCARSGADRQGFSGVMEGGSVRAGTGPKLRTAGRRSPPVQQERGPPCHWLARRPRQLKVTCVWCL